MTEGEWLSCTDPQKMLGFLRGKASDRKLQLFAVACCRQVWGLLGPDGRYAVVITERYADGLVSTADVRAATGSIVEGRDAAHVTARHAAQTAAWDTATAVAYAVRAAAYWAADTPGSGVSWSPTSRAGFEVAEQLQQVRILQDIVRHPSCRLPAHPTWITPTVVSLAQVIYDDRAFDRMPILADALEEAGCTDASILEHCRGGAEHVCGCWVVDMVLGKE